MVFGGPFWGVCGGLGVSRGSTGDSQQVPGSHFFLSLFITLSLSYYSYVHYNIHFYCTVYVLDSLCSYCTLYCIVHMVDKVFSFYLYYWVLFCTVLSILILYCTLYCTTGARSDGVRGSGLMVLREMDWWLRSRINGINGGLLMGSGLGEGWTDGVR